MAARDAVVNLTAGAYVLITDGATTTDVSLSVIDGGCEVLAGTSDTPPAASTRGFPLPFPGAGFSEATIAELFPGLTAPNRLFAKPLNLYGLPNFVAAVRISHG